MAPYFFDTSALVKRYHDEPGTQRVDELLDAPESEILISSLTVVESVSAFRRTYNRGAVSESEMEQLIGVFFREALDDFVIIPMEESFFEFSFDLVLEDDLRTLDSLQLSTARSLARDSTPSRSSLLTENSLKPVRRTDWTPSSRVVTEVIGRPNSGR